MIGILNVLGYNLVIRCVDIPDEECICTCFIFVTACDDLEMHVIYDDLPFYSYSLDATLNKFIPQRNAV